MGLNAVKKIFLESLGDGIPVIPDEAVGFYKQNCMVCFHSQGHVSGVKLVTYYRDGNHIFEVCWLGNVTNQLIRAYAELRRATDYAACAIALLLIRELTEFTGIEQSCIGSTIDYYLVPQDRDDILLFNHAARLEVSGILKENENNTVDNRIAAKIRRLKGESSLPAFIVIVEFSKPWSKMVER